MTVTLLRPTGDISATLIPSQAVYPDLGEGNFILVDEETLDTADYVYKTSGMVDNNPYEGMDYYSCGTYTKVSPVVSTTLWVYVGISLGGGTGAVAQVTAQLWTGGTMLSSEVITTSGWHSITYEGDLTQAQIDGLSIIVSVSVTSGVGTGEGGGGGGK